MLSFCCIAKKNLCKKYFTLCCSIAKPLCEHLDWAMGRNKRKSRKVRQICQLNTNSNAELTSSDTVWSAPLDARKKLTLERKYRESCKRYEEEFQKFTLLRESNNAKMHNSLQTKKFTTLNYIDPGFVLSSETEHVSETLRDPRPLSSVVKSEKWPRQVSEDFLGSQSFAEARTARPVKDKTGHVDNEFTTAFSSGNTQMQDMAKAARKLTKRRLCDVPMGNAIEDPNEIKVTNVCSTEESEGLYEVDLHVEYKIKGKVAKNFRPRKYVSNIHIFRLIELKFCSQVVL